MPKRMFAVSCSSWPLPALFPAAGRYGNRVFLNTRRPRYHVEDGIIYRYELVDAEEIQKDKATVFAAPDSFRIIAFDVARARRGPRTPTAMGRDSKGGNRSRGFHPAGGYSGQWQGPAYYVFITKQKKGIWFYKDMTAYQPWKVLLPMWIATAPGSLPAGVEGKPLTPCWRRGFSSTT